MTHYRNTIQKLRGLKKEYQRDAPLMTQYERVRFERTYNAEVARALPEAKVSALGIWGEALSDYRAVQKRIDKARHAEAQRWKPDRLSVELQLATLAFHRARSADELQWAYNEAKASGDDHKLRAFAEVFAGARSKFISGQDGMQANRLASSAARTLEELQLTPDRLEAESDGQELAKRVKDLHHELGQIAAEFDLPDLARALGQVEIGYHVDSASLAERWSVNLRDELPPAENEAYRAPEVAAVGGGPGEIFG